MFGRVWSFWATSHTRPKAHDHCNVRALIGLKGRDYPSSLHTRNDVLCMSRGNMVLELIAFQTKFCDDRRMLEIGIVVACSPRSYCQILQNFGKEHLFICIVRHVPPSADKGGEVDRPPQPKSHGFAALHQVIPCQVLFIEEQLQHSQTPSFTFLSHTHKHILSKIAGIYRVNVGRRGCHAPLHEECLKHHGHKGDLGVTPVTCGANGERAQVMLVWMRAPGIRNACHPWRLGVTKVRPWAMSSLWCSNFRILKNSPIGGVS